MTGQAVLRITQLPPAPLDAAAAFTADWLPRARSELTAGRNCALVFAPAGHEHRGWRLAMVQELAREAAPRRVNALEGAEEADLAAMLDWLARAEAITGQLLALDGKSRANR